MASLNPQEFTDKLNAILGSAQELCFESKNAQIDPVHVALAMFNDDGGMATRVAEKAAADTVAITRALKRLILKVIACMIVMFDPNIATRSRVKIHHRPTFT